MISYSHVNIISGVLTSSFDPFTLRGENGYVLSLLMKFWRVTIQTKTAEKDLSCWGGIYDAVLGGSRFYVCERNTEKLPFE